MHSRVDKQKTSGKKYACQWNVFKLQTNLTKPKQKCINLNKNLKQSKNQWQQPEQVIKLTSSVPDFYDCMNTL